jgi:molybdopterin molybdotransferase
MLTVAEAEKIILGQAFAPSPEPVELSQALGRILAEDLRADRDFPPFDRVTMDGIAIRHECFAQGQRRFSIQGVQAAGRPRLRLPDPGACLEVMTGAMLPDGTDTVIRYEDLRLEDGAATVRCETVTPGQNLHRQGTDRSRGDLLLSKGRRIGPAEIATAATVGKTRLSVALLPRTAVVSTGDELVDVGEEPLPHQIRSSNAYALHALLAGQFRLESRRFHFADDRETIRQGLETILGGFELVVLTGAVSAGKFDFVPAVLAELGVQELFHKVSQRPGKPLWFGRMPGGAVVFALPGNPVSAFMCACRYLSPFLRQSLGELPAPAEMAVLAGPVSFRPDLTWFLPCRVASAPDGRLTAHPAPGHGSGDLANLNEADGFLELPLERDVFPEGEAFLFHRYRF